MFVCVGLCLSVYDCVHLLVSVCVWVCPCVSAFAVFAAASLPLLSRTFNSIYLGKLPSENWVPPKESLLGLGQPWEPDPWECDDEAEECVLVAASQHINELVTKLHSNEDSSSRWSLPKCDAKFKKIRQDGIPKQTQNRLIEQFPFECSGLPTGVRSLKNPRPNTIVYQFHCHV